MVYVLLGNGFEEVEALAPVDILRRGGVEVRTCGIGGKTVTGGHGITVTADMTVEEICLKGMDMIVLPGGLGGVQAIRESESAMNAIKTAWEGGRYVAAICAAPTVLADLHIPDGKKATCYPGMENEMGHALMENASVTVDGKLICGQAAGSAMEFGFMLLKLLKGEEVANAVKKAMVFHG